MNMQPIIAASLLIATGFFQSTVQAQVTQPPEVNGSAQARAAQARIIVDRMASFMSRQKTYSIHAVTSRDEQLAFGYNLQRNETVDLKVKLPNGLQADATGDAMNSRFFFDGKNFTIYSGNENFYTTVAAPATVGELVKSVLSNDDVDLPLIDFLYNGTNNTLLDGVQTASYIGESVIDGVNCDHLAFRQATIDWQLWVARGDHPLPRKVVITTRFEYGDPRYSAVLSWDLSPKFNAKTFMFNAPAGARAIPFRTDGSLASANLSAN